MGLKEEEVEMRRRMGGGETKVGVMRRVVVVLRTPQGGTGGDEDRVERRTSSAEGVADMREAETGEEVTKLDQREKGAERAEACS
jgi:hypothetical protein